MHTQETLLAEILAAVVFGFLCGFWFFPGGVLALRRRAGGELQIDLRPGYRPETLYRLFELYGPEGRRSFRTMVLADLVFPAVYGALLYVLGNLVASSHPTSHRIAGLAQVLGLAAAGFDYVENIFLLAVLQGWPRQRRVAARLAGLSTSAKTLSLATALLALAAAAIFL